MIGRPVSTPEPAPARFGWRDVDLPADGGGASDTLAVAWARVAERALAEKRVEHEWVNDSTLLVCAPGALGDRAFQRAAFAAGGERGATAPAAIHAAREGDRVAFTHYRNWLPFAARVDADEIRAMALVNPAVAVREAVRAAAGSGFDSSYDDSTALLAIRSAHQAVGIDARMFAFMAIMRGYLPEVALGCAVRAAQQRLALLQQVAEAVELVVGSVELRFEDPYPVWTCGLRHVVDPLLEDGLTSPSFEAAAHAARVVEALEEPFGPGCTCDADVVPRPVLRPRAEAYSFEGDDPPEYFVTGVGTEHCLIFELACPHSSVRPTAQQWQERGWSQDRCASDSYAGPLDSEILTATTETLTSRAVLAHAQEIGSLAGSKDMLRALATTLGFRAGQRITAYVPFADVLFLSTEPATDVEELEQALREGPLLQILTETLAGSIGPPVRFLCTTTLDERAPLDVSLAPLMLALPRPGGDG